MADWITDQVVAYVARAGEPMPGVPAAIALFERSGLRLAIASSSPERLIDAVCARLKLDIDVRCSALDEPAASPPPTSTWPPRAACGSARPAAWPSKTPRPACWPRRTRA